MPDNKIQTNRPDFELMSEACITRGETARALEAVHDDALRFGKEIKIESLRAVFKRAIWLYAWMKDGTYYVGTCGTKWADVCYRIDSGDYDSDIRIGVAEGSPT